MIWEFKAALYAARKYEIKHYAIDESSGLVGGNIGILMVIFTFLLEPYSLNRFVVNNSSKKEEI